MTRCRRWLYWSPSFALVIATGLGSPVVTADAVAEQDKVTVTGTRIRRVDLETLLPVTTITREDIDSSGEISVAEALRGSTLNSFGSYRQSSGNSAQSQATVSLRGLGAQRTLVLVNGRRIAGSPSFDAGAAQNLNTIPLAAVERVEVLRDGASAAYGSDAIGGVINIILRDDFEGLRLSAGIGRPTHKGGDEETYGVTGGVGTDRGNLTFSLDHAAQDIIYNGDREFSRIGMSNLGFPGTMILDTGVARADTDGLPPAAAADLDGFYDSLRIADPRCPLTTDGQPSFSGEFPDSVISPSGCLYNFARSAANEASIDRDSFFVNAHYELGEQLTFAARGIVSRTESFGRFAPAPVSTLSMSADNINNPTAPGAVRLPPGFPSNWDGFSLPEGATDLSSLDLDGDGVGDIEGPFEISGIWYRNVPGGFRDSIVDTMWVDGFVGLEGTANWFAGADWYAGAQYSRQSNADITSGLGVSTLAQQAIDDGTFDIFGVNGPTSAAVAAGFAHTGAHDEQTRIVSFDAGMAFDAFQLDNGPVPVAVGAEYRDEKFRQNYDDLQNSGSVFGSAGGDDLQGSRVAYALYAELAVPVTQRLEMDLRLRRDHYNDFGNAVTPQISLGWRPLDDLLVRASFGEGFRAPGMADLYTSRSQSFEDGIDFLSCHRAMPGAVTRSHPGAVLEIAATSDTNTDGVIDSSDLPDSCFTTQYEVRRSGNPRLKAEESGQFGIGVVWSPLSQLSVALDYYEIRLTDEIGLLPVNEVFDAEFAVAVEDADGAVERGIAAQIARDSVLPVLNLPTLNLQGVRTSGFDFSLHYDFSVDRLGSFSAHFQASFVNEFLRRFSPTQSFRRLQQTFDVDRRAALNLSWARGAYGATVHGNHVGSTAYLDGSARLASWNTWDLQLSYETAWNGRIIAGARNLFDRDPPQDRDGLASPYYSNRLHDIYGRVPYLRYEQTL